MLNLFVSLHVFACFGGTWHYAVDQGQGVLSFLTENVPRVSSSGRISITALDQAMVRIVTRYGFMQRPHVPRILQQCEKMDVHFPLQDTTFFLGRETIEIGIGFARLR